MLFSLFHVVTEDVSSTLSLIIDILARGLLIIVKAGRVYSIACLRMFIGVVPPVCSALPPGWDDDELLLFLIERPPLVIVFFSLIFFESDPTACPALSEFDLVIAPGKLPSFGSSPGSIGSVKSS